MEPNSSDPEKQEHTDDFFSGDLRAFAQLRKRLVNTIRAHIKSGYFPFQKKISAYVARVTAYCTPIVQTFSPREKIVFLVLCGIAFVSGVGLLFKANSFFMVEIPARGGTITEGVVGTPRFINPLLALSDTDRDLTQLTYSGLLRAKENGELILDLAESFEISEDGLTYTFKLKEDLTWHDGEPLTAEDVVFTVERVQDPTLKSPKRASWEGISVEKIDDRTVRFVLSRPYSPFLENATIGLLPKHAWDTVNSEQFNFSQLNIEPIGSGPYKIKTVRKDSAGIPEYYNFIPFKNFALGKPYIQNIRITFYTNTDALVSALEKGDVDAGSAISPEKTELFMKNKNHIMRYTLPRIFGVFFNQNQNAIFTERTVREALSLSVDREKIIREVLRGYGTSLYGPLPPGSLGFIPQTPRELETTKKKAEELLDKAGWKKNAETGVRQKTVKKKTQELRFALATADTPELKQTAELLKEMWSEIGVLVEIKIYKPGDLNQNVIRPRKYDALFFGEIIGRESDPFAFWHSSQRNDPGLNIALYTNITTDKLLEEGRATHDIEKRAEIYKKFEQEIIEDVPLVPVYSPDFIYILPQKIKGVDVGTIATPSERFLDVHEWYIYTASVWKVFK